MNTKLKHANRQGAILGVVMVVVMVLSVAVLGLFTMGFHSAREAGNELHSAQAFWLAEAGRQASIVDLYQNGSGVIGETELNEGSSFEVVEDPLDSEARIAIGRVDVGGQTVVRRVRFGLAFVAGPFEKAIHAGGVNSADWTFQLRGTGSETPPLLKGGKDSVLGDIAINGNVLMAEESRIGGPNPNRYGVLGDVDVSGTMNRADTATVSGSVIEGFDAEIDSVPDLLAMKYDENHDYDVAKIFRDEDISSGRLPPSHALYNELKMIIKNPPGRSYEDENALTAGDDFYFEPLTYPGGGGSSSTAITPLDVGEDKVYYVDGHVWFHSPDGTYGFKVSGKATIVSTRDIHICDNIAYANRDVGGDLLGLVALGQYLGDKYSDDGNIYFGDPRYGTMYTVDAFMFANNNFYYNTDSVDGKQGEPTSGFKVFGNFMANNQVVLWRDWYDILTYRYQNVDYPAEKRNDGRWYYKRGESWVQIRQRDERNIDKVARAARYDVVMGKWADALDSTPLSESQIATLRHYAMQVGYDDRIRDASTQLPGLPRGVGTIFAGIKSWEELPSL